MRIQDMEDREEIILFVYSILAGICIGLGGTVFLRLKDTFPGSNVIGSFLFSIGLFVICTRGYNLFTGKACYIVDDHSSKYIFYLYIIWMGNLVGCILICVIEYFTPMYDAISPIAFEMVQMKMDAPLYSLFFSGIVCNMCIFIAVDGYKNVTHQLGKYLSIFLGVMVFILIGSEHCIADMYYWSISRFLQTDVLDSLLRLIIISLGNVVGGLIFPVLQRIKMCS